MKTLIVTLALAAALLYLGAVELVTAGSEAANARAARIERVLASN